MAITATATYSLAQSVSQDDSIGVELWDFPSNVLDDTNDTISYPYRPDGVTSSCTTMAYIDLVRANLVIDGVIDTANNEASNQRIDDYPNLVLGGTSDLWGATLSRDQVVSPDFGVAIAYGDEDAVGTPISNYLVVQNFGFTIPENATILGIQVMVDHDWFGIGGGGFVKVGVDDIQMQITFSYEPIAETSGSGGTGCYVADTGQPETQKRVRYLVSDSDNNYLGELSDVISDLSLREELNNPLCSLDIKLARNELTTFNYTDTLLTEDGDPILTESNETILVDLLAGTGLGAGTTAELNNNVDVLVSHGTFEPILTEDGQPIFTQDDHYILVQEGAPEGEVVYSGFMTDWMLDIGGEDTIIVPCINHADELNNIMLRTNDEEVISTASVSNEELGIASDGLNAEVRLAQTFTMVGNLTCSRMTFYIRSGFPNLDPTCTFSLYTGNNPNSLGTLLATASAQVKEYLDFVEVQFVFPTPLALTNASTYTVVMESNYSKTLSSAVFPMYFQRGEDYADGKCYIDISFVGFIDSGIDLAFTLWEEGADTKVPFNSYDPSQIAREVIDFARSRGAKIYYDAESIQDTGTEVSYTFNLNTVTEALQKVIELCPADWFWVYHPGTNLYTLKSRSTTPDRYATRKKDVVSGNLRRTITQLVNCVYFTGGGDPALLVRVDDAASQNNLRVGLAKMSDSRVTDEDTARIMAQSMIDRNKEPQFFGNLTLGSQHYEPIERVTPGELLGLINFGEYLDQFDLQIVGITYEVDTVLLSLDKILPRISKRIEDIKRNLDTVSQQNNPDSPV